MANEKTCPKCFTKMSRDGHIFICRICSHSERIHTKDILDEIANMAIETSSVTSPERFARPQQFMHLHDVVMTARKLSYIY